MKDKVKAKWTIKLPFKSDVLVKVGDLVDKDQILIVSDNVEIKNYNYATVFRDIETEKIVELNSKFKNELINQGDLFCLKSGFFKKKICFPISGKFLELNEFGNLKIEEILGSKKEIKSPVKSKVSKIDDEKIVLDFWVKEFNGESLMEGKAWGDGELVVIDKLDKLGPVMDGKILFTNNLETTFLLKAEVVGVVGIVTNTKVDEVKAKLPVLYLDNDNWQDLFKTKTINNRFLLNSVMGRLLMVLE